jgi:hypothetical protein
MIEFTPTGSAALHVFDRSRFDYTWGWPVGVYAFWAARGNSPVQRFA